MLTPVRAMPYVAAAILSLLVLPAAALQAQSYFEDRTNVGLTSLGKEYLLGPWEPKLEDEYGDDCNTDSDCPIDDDKFFRCMSVKGLEPNEKNTCRLAGVKPAEGNATCRCSTMICTKGPPPPADPSKLQYLMIGDCITAYVRLRKEKTLASHGIEMASSFGNAGSTNRALHCLDTWTEVGENRRWDIISFNFGLHDIAYTTEHLSIAEYRRQFGKIVEKLVTMQKTHGTKLLWITTTPIPHVPNNDDPDCETPLSLTKCMAPPRHDADVVAYNEEAAQVVQEAIDHGADIRTLDLYANIAEKCGGAGYAFCEKYQMLYNAHFTPDGNDIIADWYEQSVLDLVPRSE